MATQLSLGTPAAVIPAAPVAVVTGTVAPAATGAPQKTAGAQGTSYERRAWTRKEDEAIIRLVTQFGTKRWSVISENLNKEELGVNRTGKQCRTRSVLFLCICLAGAYGCNVSDPLSFPLFPFAGGSITWILRSKRTLGLQRKRESFMMRRKASEINGPKSRSCSLAGTVAIPHYYCNAQVFMC